jgi:ankyrin repeat protein
MYPNPQDALPLPPHPSVEQYKKLAKDLVKSCRSGDPAAIRFWASRWIEALATYLREPSALRDGTEIKDRTDQIDRFARTKLSRGGAGSSSSCVLADAQFVIARAHGFLSWPKFVKHIEALDRVNSPVSAFENAAHAIVTGDSVTLERLLREHPALIRARSTREHRATLLHYVAANGVENYRQVSPRNIAAITESLLAAGADVDSEADVYGGGCTALGLVATSAPPAIAGVQRGVIDVLLEHGARMDCLGSAGNQQPLVRACLANGQPEAAEYLVSRGAPLDLSGAAGLGRIDAVKGFFTEDGDLISPATHAQMVDGFAWACIYGRASVVDYLLDRGLAVDEQLTGHGEGHTGLHVAAFHGHADVVSALLRRGARTDVIDRTWGTAPLVWAVTGWSRARPAEAGPYYEVVSRLVAAGASVTPDLLEWDKARADPKMIAALTGKSFTARDQELP